MNNTVTHQGEMDLGLRSFMLGTYKYMITAMAVSGIAGWGMSLLMFNNGVPTDIYALMNGPLRWAIWGAPMAFVWIMGRKYHSMSVGTARFTLYGYSALIGVWLSSIGVYLAAHNPMLGAKVLLMSATMFAAISLFGYVTKKNLQGIGQFAAMAFFGVIIALVVNMVLIKSSGFDLIVSAVGLVLVAAMTAWQTQSLKRDYYATQGDAASAEKASVFGAISLYTGFINIVLLLLRLFMNSSD